jgi:hypothetical protein
MDLILWALPTARGDWQTAVRQCGSFGAALAEIWTYAHGSSLSLPSRDTGFHCGSQPAAPRAEGLWPLVKVVWKDAWH